MSIVVTPIFCCCAAAPVPPPVNHKPHHDPNRDLHETIFRSFIAYALRRHQEADRQEKSRNQTQELLQLLKEALGDSAPLTPQSFPSTPVSLSPAPPVRSGPFLESPESGLAAALRMPPQLPPPAPVLTYEALKNNPLSPKTPYVIHLTSRHDFGPVYSHRYFVCPDDLSHDWIEVSLVQWFAQGEPFKMKAEKWDLKCTKDCRFFRMTLRPNLWLRGCYSVPTPIPTPTTPTIEQMPKQLPQLAQLTQITFPVASEGTEVVERECLMPVPMPISNMEQVSYLVTDEVTESGLDSVEK